MQTADVQSLPQPSQVLLLLRPWWDGQQGTCVPSLFMSLNNLSCVPNSSSNQSCLEVVTWRNITSLFDWKCSILIFYPISGIQISTQGSHFLFFFCESAIFFSSSGVFAFDIFFFLQTKLDSEARGFRLSAKSSYSWLGNVEDPQNRPGWMSKSLLVNPHNN